ncbi:hypothetical protein AMECASPLE_021280 [Ameca splendens]|uniref:Uncharacterized protein n=1 Tax=Ameca splendens TaxID=208324 RepID=A0ABV0YF41_9TELE
MLPVTSELRRLLSCVCQNVRPKWMAPTLVWHPWLPIPGWPWARPGVTSSVYDCDLILLPFSGWHSIIISPTLWLGSLGSTSSLVLKYSVDNISVCSGTTSI